MSGTFQVSLPATAAPVVVGIANPPSQLLLFAGIATNSKGQILGNCDEDTSRMTLTLHLNRTATRILQHSSTAALASISSDEGEWQVAVDASEVRLDPATGEILLVVELAATGESMGFLDGATCVYIDRISYTAHVLVDIQAPLIAGTVRWRASDFAAHGWPALAVVAGYWITTPASPGSLFGSSTWVVVATGILEQPILVDGTYSADYVIQGVPFGRPVQVLLTSLPNFVASAPSASPGFWREHNLLDPIMLTPGQPQQLNVDFIANTIFPPR
ncbi:hypothetical protein [Massilia genomosp. 1]|uniref:Uncharacterized protein n=1 Tax=Massilia genomosp. 1 TaxID=2609280 RepID=A0ABX0MS14_9BURK|nr:hypothetical protein [Massilia genomosp. 1]NHZ63298.1 hypothetical protein [Massilia genomosp. 1]